MKKILIISKEPPEFLPPVFTAAVTLSKLRNDIVFVAPTISDKTQELFEKNSIKCISLLNKKEEKRINLLSKVLFWISFRRKALKIIETHNYDLLWIGSGDTALAIGNELFKKKFYLHIHELYDNFWVYKVLLKKFFQRAERVIVPDNARAVIFRYWYDLQSTPYIIPNKPLEIKKTDQSLSDISPENDEILKKYADKKIILYQAKMIRMKLFDMAEALKSLGDDYVLGIFGDIRDKKMVKDLMIKYNNVVHFKYMSPPYHLMVTQKARIGILTYNYESLNNIFCAPNKIYEYSSFGIPMLANNLPIIGLKLLSEKAGETYEFNEVKTIISAIKKIEDDYDSYTIGSRSLYDSVNLIDKYQKLLDQND